MGCLCCYQLADAAGEEGLSPLRQQQLHHLLLHDCGSCHGLTMKGGLGPPLTADVLLSRSDDDLAMTIADGRPGTAMPPWRPLLDSHEIRWLIQQLRQGVTP
ncbi:MAG: cytochrome c [Magnetococcales bacterium]|nr:cytochrome c [Magnetococcales bacterium]